ncbi:MAG TPA: ABC transporter ATP-binding protein [Stellaceae bacterium]|nr:ABC transporter ATP-binding protein [Stellaceae bacterium]
MSIGGVRLKPAITEDAATDALARDPHRDAFVEFLALEKTYDGTTVVVKDLNLKIHRGEFLTMLGPSGSGKTTTLMMLAGFEVPTSGRIYLDGQSIEATPPHKRDIGMVFQNYALFPHMTVEGNLAFPLEVRGVPKAEIAAKVARALDMVQLDGYQKRRPAQLSGGQQQRVALARAFVFEPKLMLMDEPLGALDKQLREHMQLEIKHLHRRLGLTAVYVTHDQSEAMTMSDRIAVFNQGRIQQVGDAVELYERPINAFVAQFIGENNRLRGTVTGTDGQRCRVALADGISVDALAVNIGAVGGPTTLSIRPERVAIDPGPDVANRFPAQVEELIYLGDHTRVRLAACGTDEFIVKVPAGHVHAGLAPGAEVTIGWRWQDCRALDA